MRNIQEQALRTIFFWQNQALFRKYIVVERSRNKQIVAAVQPVFLSILVDQLTGFGKVSALAMLQHLFTYYESIDETNLKKKVVKMMDSYDPPEPLSCQIKKLEKGR